MSAVLTLVSGCLLSKWGFNDGDEPDWLLDILDARGIEHPDDWHAILRRLVREDLLPALDQRVEVVDIDTIHNPIRAVTVDGVDVEDRWREDDPGVSLTPESVDVPVERVLGLIEEWRP